MARLPETTKVFGELAPRGQMDLRWRKQFVARLLIAQHLDANGFTGQPKDVGLLQELVLNGQRCADDEIRTACNSIRLDDYLRDVEDELTKNLKPETAGGIQVNIGQAAHQKIESFVAARQRISCISCGAENGIGADQFCTGSISDSELIYKGGACIETIKELLQLATHITNKSYSSFTTLFHDALNVRILLTLQKGGKKLGGRTEFASNHTDSQRSCIVTLDLPITSFNASHYEGLLYVLVHEICVHAVQALLMEGVPHKYSPVCQFTEGLVDAVAFTLLQSELENATSLPLAVENRKRHFLETSRQLQRERNTVRYVNKRGSKVEKAELERRTAQQQGAEMLTRLVQWDSQLAKWLGPGWVYTLVLGLNILPLSSLQREALWQTLVSFFTDGVVLGSEKAVRLERALTLFVKQGDPSLLLAQGSVRHLTRYDAKAKKLLPL